MACSPQEEAAAAARREVAEGTLILRTGRTGNVHRIELAGELDLANAATLEAEVDTLLGEPEARLVLDLRDLEFIDSTGIALFVAILGRDDAEAPRVRFVLGDSAAVSRVLDLTGLGERLPLAEA